MFIKVVMGALLALGAYSAAFANATIPTKDIAGAKDNALIKRYEGSFIVSYAHESFTDFKVPLSPLEPTDRRDGMNNRIFSPKKETELEGAKTRLAYVIPADRSPLEVLRNYEDVVKAAGGQILFTCKGDTCGGDPNRSSSGGGGDSSLMMYFLVEKELKDASYSNGSCARPRTSTISVSPLPGFHRARATPTSPSRLTKCTMSCIAKPSTIEPLPWSIFSSPRRASRRWSW